MGKRVALTAALLLIVGGTGFSDLSSALRERYLGPDGLPSEATYLRAEAVAPAPGSESYSWRVIFKLTYLSQDLTALDRVDPVATDCYLVRTRTYVAPYRAVPVWDGRVYGQNGELVIAAYTSDAEQAIGHITADGTFDITLPGAAATPLLQHKELRYDPFTGRLWERGAGGQITEEQEVYLPFPLVNAKGETVRCAFEIGRQENARFALVARSGETRAILATCAVSDDTIIKKSDGYSPQLGPGCTMAVSGPTTVLEVRGELSRDWLDARGPVLTVLKDMPAGDPPKPELRVDGDFGEWRSIAGIADPRGDIAGYLDYDPDADLLEFKVANDAQHLYFYTRVVGRHGNTAKGKDRYYWYVYIDADRNPGTGHVPTRDDDCYYGVAIGDDCEVQFEFVGSRFVKTFFGFTGVGTEKEALSGRVKLGPSWYSRYDPQGRLRDRYKVEYVKRDGKLLDTADYTEGTSEDIIMALSPDGSECEVRVELAGFLRDQSGKQIIAPGQRIDLAVGAECSGRIWGNDDWGADSTAPIHGYYIAP